MVPYWISLQEIFLDCVGNFGFSNKNDKRAEVK